MQRENNVVKTTVSYFDTTQQLDSKLDQQVRNALGRPVTRIIADRQNNIILNIGDLITYRAVELAIQADALDTLLEAVYQGNFKS